MPGWVDNIANWVFFHQLWVVIYLVSCLICHLIFDEVFKRRPIILGAKIILRIFQMTPVLNSLYAGLCAILFIVRFLKPAK